MSSFLKKLKKSVPTKPAKEAEPSNKPSISEILMDLAGDFITLVKSPQYHSFHSCIAATAWNIAHLEESQRPPAIARYLEKFPHDQRDKLQHDMELLIGEKLSRYPDVIKIIVNVKAEEEGSNIRLTVASTPYQKRIKAAHPLLSGLSSEWLT